MEGLSRQRPEGRSGVLQSLHPRRRGDTHEPVPPFHAGGADRVGDRGPALNRRIKGAAKSQHLTGEAADLQSPGLSVLALFQLAIRLKLPFDQIIYEVNGAAKWVHVSHTTGANKGEILLGKFGADGKVTYPKLTAAAALALSEPRTRALRVEPDYTELRDEPVRRTRKAKAVPQPGAL